MPATRLQFQAALLGVLKNALAKGCHIDTAIEGYLTVEGIDEDDPGLWSDLHHGCHRLFRLIVIDGGVSAPEALKLLARLGLLRDLHGEISVEWFGDGQSSRSDIAIRSLLQTLRLHDPSEGIRWWRLYTMPKTWEARPAHSIDAMTAAQSSAGGR